MIRKDKLEVMEKAITAMMKQMESHTGIKRQSSYAVLAGILQSYSERCIELSIQSTENGKREKAFKTIQTN